MSDAPLKGAESGCRRLLGLQLSSFKGAVWPLLRPLNSPEDAAGSASLAQPLGASLYRHLEDSAVTGTTSAALGQLTEKAGCAQGGETTGRKIWGVGTRRGFPELLLDAQILSAAEIRLQRGVGLGAKENQARF